MKLHFQRGFTLLEVLVATFVIVILALGITGAAVLLTRVSVDSEQQTVALELGNEQIEYLRSQPFNDIGTETAGSEVINRNGRDFTVVTSMTNQSDIKHVKVSVTWKSLSSQDRTITLATLIAKPFQNRKPSPTPITCRPGKTTHDVMLVVDSSGSIRDSDYDLARDFVKDVGTAVITPNAESRAGIVIFSSENQGKVISPLTNDLPYLHEVVNKMPHLKGDTHIGEGLNLALQEFIQRGRDGVSKNIILITDGQHNQGLPSPIEIAQKAQHEYGITIFLVVINPPSFFSDPGFWYDTNKNNIIYLSIASSRDHILPITGYNKLISVLDDISKMLCLPEVGTPTPSPTPTPTAGVSRAVYFKFKDAHDKTFVFQLTEPDKITQARVILADPVRPDRAHVAGIVVKQPASYNPPWSYYLDPVSIAFPEVSTEVCDAHVQYVEDHLALWAGKRWCPWSARLVEEVPGP